MNILQKKLFTFSQYRIQNSGGWCYGISASLLTYLYENIEGIITPERAYSYAESYAKMLSASYNKLMSSVTPGFHALRKNILSTQNELNNPFKTPGKYIYDFNGNGAGLLMVNVDELHRHYGEMFQRRFSFFGSTPNHAGMMVWAPSETFIFDPNCGGVLFSWDNDADSTSMPCIIDMMLEQMYCLYDRLKGSRKARVVSCIELETPFFGRV